MCANSLEHESGRGQTAILSVWWADEGVAAWPAALVPCTELHSLQSTGASQRAAGKQAGNVLAMLEMCLA